MQQPSSPTELAALAGISMPYASQILADKRPPSRPLAIHILRTTGWRHSVLDGLSDEEIGMLERIDPWKSPATPAEQENAA